MLEKITEILREYTSNDSLEVTETTTFEELSLDSLDTVELMMKIEDEFSVTLEMDEPMVDIGALMEKIKKAQE